MSLLHHLGSTFLSTVLDVLPIAAILLGFQVLVIRRRPPALKKLAWGFVWVLVGLSLFLVGLEDALFPLGETMAAQLTDPAFLGVAAGGGGDIDWTAYYWVYLFAAAIGFATTIAEPALIAVALKAQQISGGSISAVGLRMAVAIGVAAGVALGAFRIVTGTPLPYYIMACYVVVIVQTLRASRFIVPLAYDSGGVSTSTVTVPVVAALGLGLASTIPGRSPLIDGFGLIAFACLFPMMTVMAYAMLAEWWQRRRTNQDHDAEEKEDT